MSSGVDRRAEGSSLAFQLAVYFSGVFGLISILGGLLLFHLVRSYTQDEIDDDILRQKDELVRLLKDGDAVAVREEFTAGALASGTTDYFVRLSDADGKVLMTSDMSQWPEIVKAATLLDREQVGTSRFRTVDLPDTRRKARLLSVRLSPERYLQMGVSLESNELFFDNLRHIGMLILAVMPGLGGLTGWAPARKARAVRSIAWSPRSMSWRTGCSGC